MRRGRSFSIFFLVKEIGGTVPQVLACSVCFTDPDSSLSKGATWGALVLMGMVLSVLAGVGATLLVWARRARRLQGS